MAYKYISTHLTTAQVRTLTPSIVKLIALLISMLAAYILVSLAVIHLVNNIALGIIISCENCCEEITVETVPTETGFHPPLEATELVLCY